MSQGIYTSINPNNTTGVMLAGLLDDFKDAICSGFSGASRPSTLLAGGYWIDTTNQSAPNYFWSFKVWTGTADIEIFRLSVLNGIGGTLTADGTFEIDEIAANTTGPILQLIKQRMTSVNNGQVLSGDVVAQIQFIGRTDTATDPTVAYLKYSATDDMTSSAYGGTFTMYSTPDASATLTEHLRFINGFAETVAPQKLNALQPVSQNIATTATIAQLDASKVTVEMTGSTPTAIQGINSAQDSKVITIHNRSSASVTLKHQNSSASAADRLKLQGSVDHVIAADKSATLYYCTTDARWKLRSGVSLFRTRKIEKVSGLLTTWTAPSGVTNIRISTYSRFRPVGKCDINVAASVLTDCYGNAYMWGFGSSGQLGVGDLVPHSSPVAVLGGLAFKHIYSTGQSCTLGLTTTGAAYAWGLNNKGQLGVGDVAQRSSPVAVLGNLKFSAILMSGASSYGLTENFSLYAWGANTSGVLGVNDSVARSSPVAVVAPGKVCKIYSGPVHFGYLDDTGAAYMMGVNFDGQLGSADILNKSSPNAVVGGLTFKKLCPAGAGGGSYTIGLTPSGVAYSWGYNGNGQLGVGDLLRRSSPVAVLGGHTFADVFAVGGSVYALDSSGTLYAWGTNDAGQLGDGSALHRSSPVAVLGGITWKEIFPPVTSYVLGLSTSGDLYAWGANTNSVLGVGDGDGSTSRSSPIAVLGGLKWDDVYATNGYVIASTVDGLVYAWGSNVNWTLGVGDNVDRSSPVAVVGAAGIGTARSPQSVVSLSVTGGSSYTVFLSNGISKFGNTPIGTDIENITIEYEA